MAMKRPWTVALGLALLIPGSACSSDDAPSSVAEQIDEAVRDAAPVPTVGSTLRDGRFAVVVNTCDGEVTATALRGRLLNESEGAESLTEEDLGPLTAVEVTTPGIAVFEANETAVLDPVPAPFTQRLVEVALSVENGGAGAVSVASDRPPAFPDVLVTDFPERRTTPIDDFARCKQRSAGG